MCLRKWKYANFPTEKKHYSLLIFVLLLEYIELNNFLFEWKLNSLNYYSAHWRDVLSIRIKKNKGASDSLKAQWCLSITSQQEQSRGVAQLHQWPVKVVTALHQHRVCSGERQGEITGAIFISFILHKPNGNLMNATFCSSALRLLGSGNIFIYSHTSGKTCNSYETTLAKKTSENCFS